jgi:hypothetical protein
MAGELDGAPDGGNMGGGLAEGGYGQMDGNDNSSGFGDGSFNVQDISGFLEASSTDPEFAGVNAPAPYNDQQDLTGLETSGFFDSPLGRLVSTLGKVAISTNPIGRIGVMAYDAYNGIKSGKPGAALGGLAGMLGAGPLASAGISLGANALTGNNVSTQAAGLTGSQLGGTLGGQFGPMGGLAGSIAGGMIGSGMSTGAMGPGTTSTETSGIGEGMDLNRLGAELGSLYVNNRSSNQLGQMSQGSSMANLSDLYGPNSPYAGQLRQEMERRDAAAGRRSQYGPREVELQAKLADQYGRHAPSFSAANLQRDTFNAGLQQRQQMLKAQQLGTLYSLFRGVEGDKYIKGLFSTNRQQSPQEQYGPPQYEQPMDFSPQYPPQYEQPLDFSQQYPSYEQPYDLNP